MTYIPEDVRDTELTRKLSEFLHLRSRGKVRNTYELPGHPDKLLVVASDRISIFDFVLNALVPDKGAVLTAMTVMWLTQVLSLKNHLYAYCAHIDKSLLQVLRGNPDLQKRALVVMGLKMLPVECVVRAYLTGSGWKAYQKDQKVCGIQLLPGLHDGSRLETPIFTPTTKAQVGHDEHILEADALRLYGQDLKDLSLIAFREGSYYAEKRGVILADTKFEFGKDSTGALVLADEVLTADASRLWRKSDWQVADAEKRSPSGFDKEPVRQWGKTVETPFIDKAGQKIVGLQNLDPANQEHQLFVAMVSVPHEVIQATTERYRKIFEMLAPVPGMPLEQFQADYMGIKG